MITREGVKFKRKCFYMFSLFYDAIPLIFSMKAFRFCVPIRASDPFVPALTPPKIENFRWYLTDLISRVPKVPKTV